MCMLIYVPATKAVPEDYLRSAFQDNDDGIGVMSALGVEKFVGRKALKKARRHLRILADVGVEHAIHFRWATHGAVSKDNCHPFELPDGNGFVMHNGVLSEYAKYATGMRSDTALFVADLQGAGDDAGYWKAIGETIGAANKLCVMMGNGQFHIVNEDSGEWLDGIWYSQVYSLPLSASKAAEAYWSRFTSPYDVDYAETTMYPTPLTAALERRYGHSNVIPFTPSGIESERRYRIGYERAARISEDNVALDAALGLHLADDTDDADDMDAAERDYYADRMIDDCLLREPTGYRYDYAEDDE